MLRKGRPIRLTAADWLALAAAPTFAGMTLFIVLFEDKPVAALCTQAGLSSPLADMPAMYLLMAVFHLAPWLRLAGNSADLSRKI